MEQITIAGRTFNVPLRYAEGYQLSEREASVLNQVYHDKLRNIWTTRIKKALAAGRDMDDLQSEFHDYAEKYQFGMRAGNGRTRDPKNDEAVHIARGLVLKQLREEGRKANAKAINKAAKELASDPEIRVLAEKRIKEGRKIAAQQLRAVIARL